MWDSESSKVLLWNQEFWALESGVQLKESGIPLTIGIRNPSSNDKESGIHGVEPESRDCLGFPSHWSTLSRAKVAKNTFLLEDTTLHFSPPQRLLLGNPLKMTIIEKVASASWSARFLFSVSPPSLRNNEASEEERDVSRELTLTTNTLSEIEN